MINSLDEAILHAEEVAERLESKNRYAYTDVTCEECASEHRQLAEWLKELKALHENEDVKDVFKKCGTCKYRKLDADAFPCDRCMHRYINQYVYDDKREVNETLINDVWDCQGSLTLHSNITKEDWDRITDAEMENTPRITFKTPKGKETVYVNAENLINRIYEERTVNNNIFIEFDRLVEIIRHFEEVNANDSN